MRKLKCIISYDGTNYSGFQTQPKQRTIQGDIEKALKKMHKGEEITIYSSGRTDAGVHAKAQTFHFESPLNLPEANWQKALNNLLPADIYVHQIKHVPATFHARFDAVEREYRYFIDRDKDRDVFRRLYTYHYPYPLDVSAIKEACHYFEGEHDFTTFSSARATVIGSKVRRLSTVACIEREQELELVFRGNGFLYQMVRIMVGTLIDVGRGKLKPTDIPMLFEKKDRTFAGLTAPPHGLFLWKVTYEENER